MQAATRQSAQRPRPRRRSRGEQEDQWEGWSGYAAWAGDHWRYVGLILLLLVFYNSGAEWIRVQKPQAAQRAGSGDAWPGLAALASAAAVRQPRQR